jgi:hypothetical protein
MKTFSINPMEIVEPTAPDFTRRLRSALARLNGLGEVVDSGFARIIQGEVPNGSGNPIPLPPGLDDYFFLPGRSANQVGHGGSLASGYLALSSTKDTTKGKIYLGESLTQAAFDESTGYLGIGTVSPSALLTIAQTSALTYSRANSETPPGGGGWKGQPGSDSSNIYEYMNESVADDSLYIEQQTGGSTYSFACPDPGGTTYTGITIHYRARKNTATVNNLLVTLSRAGNTVLSLKNVGALVQGPGFTAGSYALTGAEVTDFNTGVGTLALSFDFGGFNPDTCAVSWFEIEYTIVSAGEMTRWTDSSGTVLLGVDASGDIFGGPATASTNILANNAANSTTARISVTSTPDIIFDIPTGSVDPVTISLGLASGTFTGTSLAISLVGSAAANPSTFSISNVLGGNTTIPMKVIRKNGQTGDLFEFLDFNGSTKLSYFDKDGVYNGPAVLTTLSVDAAILYSTASLPALRLRDQTGAATDMLQIQDATGVATFFRWNENAQQMTWSNGSNDMLTLKAGATSHTFELIDGLSREMLYMHPGTGAAWADSSTSGTMTWFSSNPDGKRLIVSNFNGAFSRLGWCSARMVIDNTTSTVLATPGSMLDIANRQTAGDTLQRWIPHASQSVDTWQVRDAADTTSTTWIDSVGTPHFRNWTINNAGGFSNEPSNAVFHVDFGTFGTAPALSIKDDATGFYYHLGVGGALAADVTLTLPSGGGNVLTHSNTITVSNKTFGTTGNHLVSSTASSGVDFMDTSTNTKKLRMVLSGATGNNSFVISSTAARAYTFPDAALTVLGEANTATVSNKTLDNSNTYRMLDGSTSTRIEQTGNAAIYLYFDCAGLAVQTQALWLNYSGSAPVIGRNTGAAAVGAMQILNLTAQGAAIGSTNMTSAGAPGMYRMTYYLETTTSDVTAGTIQFQIGYTDDVGATTQVSAALVLTATGRTSGVLAIYLASGEVAYQTNLTGIIGTSQYALRARLEFLAGT